jgi:hypothetical protein
MKPCPLCREQPGWALASRYSERQRASFYLLTGCEHATALASTEVMIGADMAPAEAAAFRQAMQYRPVSVMHPVADADRPAMEATVEAEFERLFVAKTAKWLPGQAQAFRASLWPAIEPPAPSRPAMSTQARPLKEEPHIRGQESPAPAASLSAGAATAKSPLPTRGDDPDIQSRIASAPVVIKSTPPPTRKPKHNLTVPQGLWYQREESDLF